ncbi:hypothetical protein EL17_06045 [Anditalea andensis]|uniref:Dystroglycan-type cadherin-like domain-containing protein n=1 Tax=Anditalea andensis TaxID=1048983 RepID=A0A074L436_9BACT|nr:hypothetical protein EL17_06045 [Anditalea andensis]
MSYSCTSKKHTEVPNISYLDQESPDSIPIIFGKDIVSVKGRFDMGITISPDGKSIAFGVANESNPNETCIYLMNYINGKWTSPNKSFLPNNINTFYPMFSPSGNELYFAKSIDGSPTDLWVAAYIDQKANNPQPLDSIFNSKSREAGHSISKTGTLYFTSNRDDQHQCCGDIYYAQLDSGRYSQIQKSDILSSEADEESLFLSPDENYIIVQAWKYESESKHDLYISYRTKEGAWTVPKRLNSYINGKEIEQRPFVSPDNKFLIFSRTSVLHENEQDVYDSDIYWVSTKSVFSPYVYKSQIEASIRYKEAFELRFPQDLFKDVDDDKLSFYITLKDNSAIPEWMAFDDEQLILSGNWTTKEPLTFKLTATDISGNSGEFIFDLEPKNNQYMPI